GGKKFGTWPDRPPGRWLAPCSGSTARDKKTGLFGNKSGVWPVHTVFLHFGTDHAAWPHANFFPVLDRLWRGPVGIVRAGLLARSAERRHARGLDRSLHRARHAVGLGRRRNFAGGTRRA